MAAAGEAREAGDAGQQAGARPASAGPASQVAEEAPTVSAKARPEYAAGAGRDGAAAGTAVTAAT